MTNEVFSLGTLAAKAQLEAMRHPEGSGARLHLLDISNRYRDAQYEVLAAESEYAFADILEEEGVYLDPEQKPVCNVLQFLAIYIAILLFCFGAVVAVHHFFF